MIKVTVIGACGRMGQEVVKAVLEDNNMELVGAVDINNIGESVGNIKITDNLEETINNTNSDVIVDFTIPDSVFKNAQICLNNNVRPVIGTTGLSEEQLEELENLSKEKNTSVLIAPNFTIGAVLMMMFSKKAAEYFDNAEIIEFHHNQKKDAPSGTAVKTAQMMAEVKNNYASGNVEEVELIEGSRGGNAKSDIHIHSVRMPGYVASQEVMLGSSGQVLKIRHDSIDRSCYMPGVKLAINNVMTHNDFIYGLENIL